MRSKKSRFFYRKTSLASQCKKNCRDCWGTFQMGNLFIKNLKFIERGRKRRHKMMSDFLRQQ